MNFARFDVINDFSVDIVGETIGSKIPMLVLFDESNNRDFLSILEELHEKIQYNFIIVHNKNKEEFERHYMEILGVDRGDIPVLMIAMI